MNDHRPTDYLGESISKWDSFFEDNYQWIFDSSFELLHSRMDAENLTHRILINLLLSHPEVVISSDREKLKAEVIKMFPSLSKILVKPICLKAQSLLDLYYQPN